MSSEPCTRSRCFSALLTSLNNALEQFTSASPPFKGDLGNFDATRFKTLLGQSAAALAQEGNKLAIAFRTDPVPSAPDTRSMCAHAEQRTVLVLSMYLSMPPDSGKHVLDAVGKMCANAVAAMIDLVKALEARESQSLKKEEADAAILRTVGAVWEKCDSIAKDCPASNGECCAKVLKAQRLLVTDAVKELEEAVKAATDESETKEAADGYDEEVEEEECPGETWTPNERLLVAPGTGLLKTSAALLKKVSESVGAATASDNCPKAQLMRYASFGRLIQIAANKYCSYF